VAAFVIKSVKNNSMNMVKNLALSMALTAMGRARKSRISLEIRL
jgi:hypothetical protein